MVVQVVTLAFLVVGASVGVMIPIMLYVLDLRSSGWTWEYVALFISMLASTDAVAIIATMKTSALLLPSGETPGIRVDATAEEWVGSVSVAMQAAAPSGCGCCWKARRC